MVSGAGRNVIFPLSNIALQLAHQTAPRHRPPITTSLNPTLAHHSLTLPIVVDFIIKFSEFDASMQRFWQSTKTERRRRRRFKTGGGGGGVVIGGRCLGAVWWASWLAEAEALLLLRKRGEDRKVWSAELAET